jgi:hypothetical protein
MTVELAVAVLASLLVPTQPATLHPLAGLAVSEIASLEWYCPDEHPDEFPGDAVGSLPDPVCVLVSE